MVIAAWGYANENVSSTALVLVATENSSAGTGI